MSMTKGKILYKQAGLKEGMNYRLNVPIELLYFFSNDYFYKDIRRFSRLQAFQSLVELYCTSERRNEDVGTNIEFFAKIWGWSRPSVIKFVSILEKMKVVEIVSVVNRKIIRLQKGIVILNPIFDEEK